MLEPYAPKGSEEIESAFKDDKEVPSWVGIDAWMTGITVNTKELSDKNIPVPSSYEDLIKPEYKGLISMPNPSSSGTGYLTVSALIQIMGKKKHGSIWISYMRILVYTLNLVQLQLHQQLQENILLVYLLDIEV